MPSNLDFEIIRLDKAQAFPSTFLKHFQYSDDIDRQYVSQVAKLATKDRARIHVFADTNGQRYGFVSLKVDSFGDKPSIVISYIFSSLQYRGIRFQELENGSICEALIGWTIKIAQEIKSVFPLRFIALEPANDRLASFYQRLGFKRLDSTNWMFLAI